MKEYVFLFRGGLDFKTASPDQLQKAMTKWKNWIDELAKQGKFTGGHRLLETGSVMKEKKHITDGPFAESKEIIGGFVSVKADDLQEAEEIAKGCPIFDYNGNLEVREIAPATM
jgi:hypothetical protein